MDVLMPEEMLYLEKLRQDDRKRFTPDYILQKDYQKSPYSFFWNRALFKRARTEPLA